MKDGVKMDVFNAAKEFFSREDIISQAVSDLREIIAVPSVASLREGAYPFGAECARAVDKACALAEKYGFRTENHDYYCASILFGDAEREVGIVCHLDVVPAGEGWESNPFALTERDGLLIGRGAHDDKGPFIQALYTLRFFKECGINLPFTVRIILGSDEEVGCSDLVHFREVRKPPEFSFTPDSEFPVCIGEKGLLSVNISLCPLPQGIISLCGGTVTNAVPAKAQAEVLCGKELPAAEGICVVRNGDTQTITATGKSAHAAMPEHGVNAIAMLASYLLDNLPLDDKSAKAFAFLRDSCGEYLGKTLGIACADNDFGYLTCIGGVLKTVGDTIVQNYNIRYLPSDNAEAMTEKIRLSASARGYVTERVSSSEGYFVSAEDERIKALTASCAEILGISCEPYTMGGGTYARMLPNTVAFGSGIPSERTHLGEERGGPHQRDEYISRTEFFEGMRIYSGALGRLSKIF